MAASMTVHVDHNPFLDGRAPARITIDWVSHTDGVVSLKICSTLSAANLRAAGNNAQGSLEIDKIRGTLHKIETIPGLYNGYLAPVIGDTPALPTDLYDITLLDPYGLDVADGTLVNRSGTLPEVVVFSGGKYIVDSEITVTIANAGDSKKGRIIIDLLESEDRP